jgi:predicted transcriptional regulator
MPTAKDEMIALINEQPEDSNYDELLRELAFKKMVDRGLDDSHHGRTITNDEMSRRIRSWQK